MPLPSGLTARDAANAALRVATLDIVDRNRRSAYQLASRVPRSLRPVARGGMIYRGRPTYAWAFGFRCVDGAPQARYHLLGVQSKRQAYFAAYPALLTVDEDESIIGDWIAADARAYSERERILALYRRRLRQKPESSARLYELALMGTALGCCFLARSKVDLLYHPGPLEEFLPYALEAVPNAPRRAPYLALAAFLNERLTRFEHAARLYGEAAAADPRSAIYAFLRADALLFAGDLRAARKAAREAERRARASRMRHRFGLHRGAVITRFKESLHDEAWAIRKKVEKLKDPVQSDRAIAEAHRKAIAIDPKRVPALFHDLIPLAKKWGVGDDPSRGYFTDRATAKDKTALQRALPLRRRGEIQDWLDALGPQGITSQEAGAFMYLLEAVEELGL